MRLHHIWRIAALEFRLLRRDRTVWLVLGLLAFVIPCSVAIGTERTFRLSYGNRDLNVGAEIGLDWLQARTEKMQEQRRRDVPGPIADDEFFWGPRKSPYAAWWRPLHATLPPAPLQALAVGESDVLPSAYQAHPWRMEAQPSAEAVDNPLQLRNAEFDLANVVVLFFPLLVIAVTFNLVAGERESGVLNLTLSQPIRLSTWLWAKVLSRFVLVTGAVFVFTWIAAWAGNLVRFDSLPLLLLWSGATILYACFWSAMAVLINLGRRSAATNGLILCLLWVWLVLVLPTGVAWLARNWYPTPSRAAWIAADRIAKQEIYKYPMHHNPESISQDSRFLQRFGENHPEFTWDADEELGRHGWETDLKYRDVDFFRDGRGPRLNAAWAEEYDRRLGRIEEEFWHQRSLQQKLVWQASMLSPAISLHTALHELAGTSGARHKHYLGQRDRYFDELHHFLWPLAFTDAVFTPEDFDRMPRFSYHEEPSKAVFARALQAMIPLGLIAFSAIGLVWRLLRSNNARIAIT